MDYPIAITVGYQRKLSRLSTFFRGLMVIPRGIALWALGMAASTIVFVAWWVILFTGTYPKQAFDFVTSYIRWYTRVSGYCLLLTDKYPLFSIE